MLETDEPRVSRAPVRNLASEAWRLHAAATIAEPRIRVTRPSAPILYFGSLEAYRASPLRVVTVGVNPSGEEFPTARPWSRLACGDFTGSETPSRSDDLERYLATLNAYFERSPYDLWFRKSYENVLRGMDASYYQGARSTAVHTDVCSPLATSPTWGQLDEAERKALATDGVPLWHRLIDELEPHVILASISAPHFARIKLEQLSEPEVVYQVPQKRGPYLVTVRRVRCASQDALLLWAGASTTPFQPISHEHKRAVGAAVRSMLDD